MPRCAILHSDRKAAHCRLITSESSSRAQWHIGSISGTFAYSLRSLFPTEGSYCARLDPFQKSICSNLAFSGQGAGGGLILCVSLCPASKGTFYAAHVSFGSDIYHTAGTT